MQIQVLIIAAVARDEPVDQRCPFIVAVRIRQAYPVQAVLQAAQVFSQAERLARIHRDDFIHTVAENEAAIQHGNRGFLDGHVLAVQIYGHGLVPWNTNRMLSHPRENTLASGTLSNATSGYSA